MKKVIKKKGGVKVTASNPPTPVSPTVGTEWEAPDLVARRKLRESK